MSSVLSEHLQYLNLPGRFDLFARAIAEVVKPGDIVADLGCGIGVLGLQCLQAGASRVYGVDHSDAIELARETMVRQGLSERYVCIRGSSFRTELPEPVDVIVCDHVGFMGIDYGIVAMLEDARRRMLKPGGRVIPRRLDLSIAPVSSAECAKLSQAWSAAPVPAAYAWLNAQAANTLHPVELDERDLAGAPAPLGLVRLDADNPGSFQFAAELSIAEDGEVHGLAGWFDCELADGVWMTNSPFTSDSIKRPQAYFPLEHPIAAQAGDVLQTEFRIRHDDTIIAWTVAEPATGKRQKMTNWKSRALTERDLRARHTDPLSLNREGQARQAILGLVDGERSADEIEALVLERYPDLFPSRAETSRFVRAELARGART